MYSSTADRDAIAKAIVKKYSYLEQDAKVEGSSAYLKKPPVRTAINQRYLQNTLKTVTFENKQIDMAQLWGTEERSHHATPNNASRKARASASRNLLPSSSTRSRHSSHSSRSKAVVCITEALRPTSISRSPPRKRTRSVTPETGEASSPTRRHRRDTSSKRKKSKLDPRMEGCVNNHEEATGQGTAEGRYSTSPSPGPEQESPSLASSGFDGSGDGVDGLGDASDQHGIDNAAMDDILSRGRVRGRGGRGSRVDSTGPFLDPNNPSNFREPSQDIPHPCSSRAHPVTHLPFPKCLDSRTISRATEPLSTPSSRFLKAAAIEGRLKGIPTELAQAQMELEKALERQARKRTKKEKSRSKKSSKRRESP